MKALTVACAEIDAETIASLTMDLVNIWSPPKHEAEMADRLATELTAAGARVRIDTEYPTSPSVIAELGPCDGPTLQWHGHLDAVDVPHAPAVRSVDRIHGRGSADMKGPLAAMVSAVRLLAQRGLPSRGRVLITLHGMHESGGNEPLHSLIRRGVHGDAVITGELGGGKELPIASLGLVFWEITVSRPGAGMHETSLTGDMIDPLEVGRHLHADLAELRDRLEHAAGESPAPSLFVATFHSGDYVNRVALRAQLSGTRRFDSTMSAVEATDELRELVERVRHRTGATIDLDVVEVADSFQLDRSESIVGAVQQAHFLLMGTEIPLSTSRIATNAVHFVREAGIPAVAYGPDPATNHSDDESIALPELSRIAGCFALSSEIYLNRSALGA